MTGATKRCKDCGEHKLLAAFCRRSLSPDGHYWYCKSCEKERDLARAKVPKQKSCPSCRKTLAASRFHFDRRKVDCLYSICKQCVAEKHATPRYLAARRAKYRTPSGFKQALIRMAKERARKYNLPFDITAGDISLPSHCPVLGIPLIIGSGGFSPNAPTLDRIIPVRGYVKGNVAVISFAANRIKGDQTDPSVFDKIAAYLRKWPVGAS